MNTSQWSVDRKPASNFPGLRSRSVHVGFGTVSKRARVSSWSLSGRESMFRSRMSRVSPIKKVSISRLESRVQPSRYRDVGIMSPKAERRWHYDFNRMYYIEHVGLRHEAAWYLTPPIESIQTVTRLQ